MKQTIKTLKFIVSELERRGFEVTVNDGNTRVKGPTLKYREEVDAPLFLQMSLVMVQKTTTVLNGKQR